MRQNILWKGLYYTSMENCMLTGNATGFVVNSQVTGLFENKIMRIDYQLQLDHTWKTLSIIASSRQAEHTNALSFTGDGEGNWRFNDKPAPEFNGCIDVDISVTPFTNSLPVKRLKLNINEQQLIKVFYINLPDEKLQVMEQRYTKLSDTEYLYQNVGSHFEAVISLDKNGLVVNYPGIFERIGIEGF